MLNDDGYGSDRERVHGRDIARLHREEQQNVIQATQQPGLDTLAVDELVQLFEAKFADIPVPFGAKPIKEYFENAVIDAPEVSFGYVSKQSIDELALFYLTFMKQFDWCKLVQFSGIEQLLVFEKPSYTCIISLRSQDGWFYQNGYTQIILFVRTK